MKRLVTVIFGGILLLSIDVTAQQNPTNLIGEWTLNYQETLDLMSTETKAKYDSIDASFQGQMQNQLSSQTFTFNSDTTFQVSAGGYTNNGNWNINNDQLILTFASGAQTTQTIESLNENQLILKIVQDPNSEALFQRIYLSKNTN